MYFQTVVFQTQPYTKDKRKDMGTGIYRFRIFVNSGVWGRVKSGCVNITNVVQSTTYERNFVTLQKGTLFVTFERVLFVPFHRSLRKFLSSVIAKVHLIGHS